MAIIFRMNAWHISRCPCRAIQLASCWIFCRKDWGTCRMNDVPLFLPYWQNERDASQKAVEAEVGQKEDRRCCEHNEMFRQLRAIIMDTGQLISSNFDQYPASFLELII